MAEISRPLLAQHFSRKGKPCSQTGTRRAMLVGLYRPDHPDADFLHRIDGRRRDRDDDEGEDQEERDRGAEGAVSAYRIEHPPVDRPAGETDHQCRKHRHDKAMKK